jgi:hypothetical protein
MLLLMRTSPGESGVAGAESELLVIGGSGVPQTDLNLISAGIRGGARRGTGRRDRTLKHWALAHFRVFCRALALSAI